MLEVRVFSFFSEGGGLISARLEEAVVVVVMARCRLSIVDCRLSIGD